MKKILLVSIAILGLIFSGFSMIRFLGPTMQVKAEIISPVTITPTPKSVGIPKTLKIPKLGLWTQIETVGQDKKGNMDVPQNVMNVAWYKLGVKPGEHGSAVIAGHLDTSTGDLAVFFKLNELVVGDDVVVLDDQDRPQLFKVIDVQTYETKNFPIEEVFSKNDGSNLQLVTCEGKYNSKQRSYSHRLVVYTKLVN